MIIAIKLWWTQLWTDEEVFDCKHCGTVRKESDLVLNKTWIVIRGCPECDEIVLHDAHICHGWKPDEMIHTRRHRSLGKIIKQRRIELEALDT